MILKRERVEDEGQPEYELPDVLRGLLEEHDGEGKASQRRNPAGKEWQDPEIRHQMERLEQLLDPEKIRDEASGDAFVDNLRRVRRKLRETVDRRLEHLREAIDEPPEGADDDLPLLKHLETRWSRLSQALSEGSPYAEELELEARCRWRDAHRAGNPIGVLATCAVFAAAWLLIAAAVYFIGFLGAVADWQPEVTSVGKNLEAILRPPAPGFLLLLVLATLAASWLAYRWLVVSSVRKAAVGLKDHVGALARYARLVLPLPDDDDLPLVPRPRLRFSWSGLPSLPVVFQLRTVAVILLAFVPLGACWWLGRSKEPYHVMAGLESCRNFHGLVVQRTQDHLVFFADLEELRQSGSATVEDPQAGYGAAAFGALILPVSKVVAMAEGRDDLVPCPPVGADSDGETAQGERGTAELVGVLESISGRLEAMGETQERTTRKAAVALGLALGELGSGLEASGRQDRVLLQRLIETASTTHAELEEVEKLLREAAGSWRLDQGELLRELESQTGLLEEQMSVLDDQATVARLDFCLKARNNLVKTLRTLSSNGEDRYVQALEERCRDLLSLLDGIEMTSNGRKGVLNVQGP